MLKKCIYCKKEISQESVIDFCSNCGIGVWGGKCLMQLLRRWRMLVPEGILFLRIF
jgi:uncharacterized UBP type Zn finger protein